MEEDKKVSSFTYDLLEREDSSDEQRERREVRRKKLEDRAKVKDDPGKAKRARSRRRTMLVLFLMVALAGLFTVRSVQRMVALTQERARVQAQLDELEKRRSELENELLMVNSEFDFPFLQALLLRCKVVHIGVGNIIGISEHSVLASTDDPLTQTIQGLIVVSHIPGIQYVIIIPSAVEANQLLAEKLSDLGPGRIYHSHDALAFSGFLPVHKQQIRKDLNIKEYWKLVPVRRRKRLCRQNQIIV